MSGRERSADERLGLFLDPARPMFSLELTLDPDARLRETRLRLRPSVALADELALGWRLTLWDAPRGRDGPS